MDPLGGGPLHSLNDRTASVQRCMVIAAVKVQTVEEECHACKHQPNYCPQHARLLFSVFLKKGSTLDASQTLDLILLDHSEAGLSLDKADKEDCESKQLVISHAVIYTALLAFWTTIRREDSVNDMRYFIMLYVQNCTAAMNQQPSYPFEV